MKDTSQARKNRKKTLFEKNINIHKNLWKVYFFFLFIGIVALSIKGLN